MRPVAQCLHSQAASPGDRHGAKHVQRKMNAQVDSGPGNGSPSAASAKPGKAQARLVQAG